MSLSVFCWYAMLDGTRNDTTSRVHWKSRHVGSRYHSHRVGLWISTFLWWYTCYGKFLVLFFLKHVLFSRQYDVLDLFKSHLWTFSHTRWHSIFWQLERFCVQMSWKGCKEAHLRWSRFTSSIHCVRLFIGSSRDMVAHLAVLFCQQWYTMDL